MSKFQEENALKEKALKGIKWSSICMGAITTFQLIRLGVLARFLAPEDFGLMAIVMTVIGFSQAFMDMGISNAIIHKREVSDSQLSSLYWLNLISGFTLMTIVIVLAPLIANFYAEPQLLQLTLLISPVFFITAIGQQFHTLCQKKLQFKTITLITMTSDFIATAIAIYLAWRGEGVMALVYALLISTALNSLGFSLIGLKNHHIPSFTYQHYEIQEFYTFGFYQMGERSINYISANIDKLLIGKLIGMEALGFYNMAWQFIIFPLSRINPIINNVAFPIYSKLQNNDKLRSDYYTLCIKTLSLLTIPFLAFLCYFSNDIVLVVFGQNWDETTQLIKILAIVGVAKALGNPGGALILSLGRADIGFWWNVVWALVVSVSIFVTLNIWPRVETAAYTLLLLSFTFGFIWHYLIAKIGNLKYHSILLHFFKILIIFFIAGFFSSLIIDKLDIDNATLRLTTATTFNLILYGLYIFTFEKKLLSQVTRK